MTPDDIESLVADARDAIQRGDCVRALALADQLVALRPRDGELRALRAEVLIKGDNAEEAFHEGRRAVELDPQSESAHTILGLAAWRSARLTLAQQSLERALVLSGGRPALMVDYAWFMAAERGPRLAEEAAMRAISVADNSSTAWAALGLVQFRLHRRQEAETSLKRALALDPNDPYAQLVTARLLQDQRQDAKAVALAHLLEDTPGTEDLVAEIRKQAKRREVAGKLVQRSAMPEQRDAEPRYYYRWVIVAAMITTMLAVYYQPTTPLTYLFCVAFPLLMVWPFRKFFG